ncbi:Nif11-like leader peptide family natural product precursor [Moorena producens JHB]|uniref:Nif11-like leader peptide family natural product n=1 Tax=Moorena producens (strain JHB) TaxID=1454205 RepID=A0A1D9FX06_MOOP1|nr:Nif11-like leader peptide family natural product precursor [Moorena producens]AOY79902.1 Nif11-like leader peptide family natural product precursor [Moorena producens JHB]
MFLESVILFFKRLAADKNFRSQLEDAASPEDYQTMVRDAGYDFTAEDLETTTAKILDENKLRDLDDNFKNLSEEDLEVLVGGVFRGYCGWPWQRKHPIYRPRPIQKPPIEVQPLYGAVISPPIEIVPKPPQAIAMYGVSLPPDQIGYISKDANTDNIS